MENRTVTVKLDAVLDVLTRVDPMSILADMGIDHQDVADGQIVRYLWNPVDFHIATVMHAPMLELSCKAAVRVVRFRQGALDREQAALEYFTALRSARSKFVRRVWRLLSPLAA